MSSQGRDRGKVLIIDDEEKVRTILALVLREEGYEVAAARDGREALAVASGSAPSVVVADLQMPGMDGIETIRRIKEAHPSSVGIILTAHGTIPSAVQAVKQGVYDYISKPFDNEQMLIVVGRAMEVFRLTEAVDQLRKELRRTHGVETIIGRSALLEEVRNEILRMASADATVLVEGESGTGKELAARAIHYESGRSNGPLVVVDCAAVPSTLIEAEFFGHERGAFTDALERRSGKFEEAHGGTIFLDEIGELPTAAQTRLLRVIQEKEFTRVGGVHPIRVDVRVIAATNRDLEKSTREGHFREDLFYRLNVLKLRMPPLRDHADDIPLYVEHFLGKHKSALGKNLTGATASAIRILRSQRWKGNVRELENVIQRAMLNAGGTALEERDLGFLSGREVQDFFRASGIPGGEGLEAAVSSMVERTERQMILEALLATGGNRTLAAELLRISRKTLFNKMKQYGLEGAPPGPDRAGNGVHSQV